MLKQDRFRSIIAISGTALAIMMIMVIMVTDEIRNIAVAPEINRNRTYYIDAHARRDSVAQSMHSGDLPLNIILQYVSGKLNIPEQVSLLGNIKEVFASQENSRELHSFKLRITDDAYWKILSFNFIEGIPFTKESVESGIHEVVVSETTARTVFKGEKALGQTILLDFIPYRVIGIVKDISPVFSRAESDIWISYNTPIKVEGHTCMLLLKDKKDYPKLVQEIRDQEKKYGTENTPWQLYFTGPLDHRITTMDVYGQDESTLKNMIRMKQARKTLIFIILLLIPAVNLSGLTLSHIKRRMAEIGVRKAFGAKRHTILVQVLWENMLTSFIGGVLGLLLSYPVIFYLKEWLLSLPAGQFIPLNTLLSIPIACSVMIVCILINLLSAGIPAYRASRLTIIQSLTKNNR